MQWTTYHNIPSQSFDKVVTYKVRNHLTGIFHVRVSKKNHATITQRYKCFLHAKFGNWAIPRLYKCFLHAKFGNQPYPDYINVSYMLSLVINHTQIILPKHLYNLGMADYQT
jgi:hypothetical protein